MMIKGEWRPRAEPSLQLLLLSFVLLFLSSGCVHFTELSSPEQGEPLHLPADLPSLESFEEIAPGLLYLSWPGEKGGGSNTSWPPFHLLVADLAETEAAGMMLQPLKPYPRGASPLEAGRDFLTSFSPSKAKAGAAGKLLAVINGTPFRYKGLPFLSSRLPAGTWLVEGKDYGSGENRWGMLYFDGSRYTISEGKASLAELPELVWSRGWAVGGYLPVLLEGENIGIDGERHARTAIGLSERGGLSGQQLYILIVEGEGLGYPGLTSRETAALLSRYGAVDGINLDGGDASSLALWTPSAPGAGPDSSSNSDTDRGGEESGALRLIYRGRRRSLPCYLVLYRKRNPPTGAE